MFVEAKRFLPRAVLLPFLAVGTIAFESIVSTPIAEADGCSDGKVITGPWTSEDELRKMEEFCRNNPPIIHTQDTTSSSPLSAAIPTILGVGAGLYYYYNLRRRVY